MKFLSLGNKKWVKVGLFLFLLSTLGMGAFTGSLFVASVLGATVDSATGGFTIDSIPDLQNPNFVNGTDFSAISTLYPDNSLTHGVNFTIDHNGQMNDLFNVTVYIFDDSVYGGTWQTASPDGLQLIRAVWLQSTSAWTINQGSFTEWGESGSIDPISASTATSFDWVFIFDISRAARYDTDWNCTVVVFDQDDDTDSDAETALVTMAQNFEISHSSSTFSWGQVESNSVNSTHGSLTLTIRANYNWELLINATDVNGTIDIEAQNIFAWDADGSNGGTSQWLRNTRTVAQGNWDAQSPMTTETPFTGVNWNEHYFLSTGTYFTEGSYYEITVYVWIQADT